MKISFEKKFYLFFSDRHRVALALGLLAYNDNKKIAKSNTHKMIKILAGSKERCCKGLL